MHRTRGPSHRGGWELKPTLCSLTKLCTMAHTCVCPKEGVLFLIYTGTKWISTALLTIPKWEVPSSHGRAFLPGCPFLLRNPIEDRN